MAILAIIPALVCLVALFRRSLPQVFLNVYLPIFVLFPSYYYWKVAALPPIDVAQAALLPIGGAIVLKLLPRWRFTTTDLWVAAFMLSTFVADYRNNLTTAAIFDLFNSLIEGMVPYMIGKTLIEQAGIRVLTARRIVMLMLACFVISLYEYKMGVNPFTLLWGRFFPDESFAWKTQIRWGFGRASGPYGQSELAGMVILFAIMMAVWLSYSYPWAKKFAWLPQHPFEKRTIILVALVGFMFMTQARGPWLGCALAIPIALIGRTKRVLRNSLILAFILLPLGAGAYVAAKRYTSGNVANSEAQQNAQYRAQLLDNYIPVAKEGGAFGWGQDFPQQQGQGSIDNEYLFVWLLQGWVGVISLLLIAGESLVRIVKAAIISSTRADRFFAFSLFGAFVGILLTITTVFLGNQPFQLFFLIAGWAQVLNRTNPEEKRFEFGHVLA